MTDARPDAPAWFLEYFDGDLRRTIRVALAHVPFRIGRRPGLELSLPSPEISSEHAEVSTDGSRFLIRDLGSRNGTFLRHLPVGDGVPLAAGDVFQVGPISLRLGHAGEQRPAPSHEPERAAGDLSSAFNALLESAAVEPLFQPVVDLQTGATVALEALGRGRSPDLPQSPVELFRIAEATGEARELARCFRQTALAAAHWARIRMPIFFNVHSSELAAPDFFNEIEAIRAQYPKIRLVLEVSEQHSTPLARLRALRAFLTQQGIGLSYDDFGAGLARILELAEAPADYLKFDAVPIRGLHQASDAEKRRLSALVAAARALGMTLLAKGIESAPEAEACIQLGFELGQGYFFGHPAALATAARR